MARPKCRAQTELLWSVATALSEGRSDASGHVAALGPNVVHAPPWRLAACFRPRFNIWRVYPALLPPPRPRPLPRPRKRREPSPAPGPSPTAPGPADVALAAAAGRVPSDVAGSGSAGSAADNAAAAHWPAEEADQQLAALIFGRADSQLFVAFPLDQFVEMALWCSWLWLWLDLGLIFDFVFVRASVSAAPPPQYAAGCCIPRISAPAC